MEPSRRCLVLAVTKSDLGGAQRHVLDLALGLASSWDVRVITGGPGWLAAELDRRGIPVHIVSMDNGMGPMANLKAIRGLRRVLGELRPDILHLHSTKMGALGRLARSATQAKVVYTVHGWPFGPGYAMSRRFAMRLVERALAGRADAIVTVSHADEAIARNAGIGKRRVLRTIHNGVADGPQRTPNGEEEGTFEIGMLSRLAPPKDPVTLIRAFAALGEGNLAFFGDGPLHEEVEAATQEAGISHSVRIIPPPHEQPWLGVDVAVLSSRSEGFPLVILEAMRAGLPVVAANVGGVGEAVVEGTTGFLFPAGDGDRLADHLRTLAHDPALRRRMGNAGRRRFEELFRVERMVQDTQRLYDELLGESG